MNDDLSLFLIKKFEDDINKLQNKLHDIDKVSQVINHKISEIEERMRKDEAELRKVQSRKFSNILADNWQKIPQLAMIVGGVLWISNWLYDLPSPKQAEEIKKLTQNQERH